MFAQTNINQRRFVASALLALVCSARGAKAQDELAVLTNIASQTSVLDNGSRREAATSEQLAAILAANPNNQEALLLRVARALLSVDEFSPLRVKGIVEDLRLIIGNSPNPIRFSSPDGQDLMIGREFLVAELAANLLALGEVAESVKMFEGAWNADKPQKLLVPCSRQDSKVASEISAGLMYGLSLLLSGREEDIQKLGELIIPIRLQSMLAGQDTSGASFAAANQLEAVVKACDLWKAARDTEALTTLLDALFAPVPVVSQARAESDLPLFEHIILDGSPQEAVNLTPVTREIIKFVLPKVVSRVETRADAQMASKLCRSYIELSVKQGISCNDELKLLVKLEERWGSKVVATALKLNEQISREAREENGLGQEQIKKYVSDLKQKLVRADISSEERVSTLESIALASFSFGDLQGAMAALNELVPYARAQGQSLLQLPQTQIAEFAGFSFVVGGQRAPSQTISIPFLALVDQLLLPCRYLLNDPKATNGDVEIGQVVDSLILVPQVEVLQNTPDSCKEKREAFRTLCQLVQAAHAAERAGDFKTAQLRFAEIATLHESSVQAKLGQIRALFAQKMSAAALDLLGKVSASPVRSPADARARLELVRGLPSDVTKPIVDSITKYYATEVEKIGAPKSESTNLSLKYLLRECASLAAEIGLSLQPAKVGPLATASNLAEVLYNCLASSELRAVTLDALDGGSNRFILDKWLGLVLNGDSPLKVLEIDSAQKARAIARACLSSRGEHSVANLCKILELIEPVPGQSDSLSPVRSELYASLSEVAPDYVAGRILRLVSSSAEGARKRIEFGASEASSGDVVLNLIGKLKPGQSFNGEFIAGIACFVKNLEFYRRTKSTRELDIAKQLVDLISATDSPAMAILRSKFDAVSAGNSLESVESAAKLWEIVLREQKISTNMSQHGQFLRLANDLVIKLEQVPNLTKEQAQELSARFAVRGLLRFTALDSLRGTVDLQRANALNGTVVIAGRLVAEHYAIALMLNYQFDKASEVLQPVAEKSQSVKLLSETISALKQLFTEPATPPAKIALSVSAGGIPAGFDSVGQFLEFIYPALARSVVDKYSQRLTELAGELVLRRSPSDLPTTGSTRELRYTNAPVVDLQRSLLIVKQLVEIRAANSDWSGAMEAWREVVKLNSQLVELSILSDQGVLKALAVGDSRYIPEKPTPNQMVCIQLDSAARMLTAYDYVGVIQICNSLDISSNSVGLELRGKAQMRLEQSAAAAEDFRLAAKLLADHSLHAVTYDREWWLGFATSYKQSPLFTTASDRAQVVPSFEQCIAGVLVLASKELVTQLYQPVAAQNRLVNESAIAFWRSGDFSRSTSILYNFEPIVGAGEMPPGEADNVLTAASRAASQVREALSGRDLDSANQLLWLNSIQESPLTLKAKVYFYLHLRNFVEAEASLAKLEAFDPNSLVASFYRLHLAEQLNNSSNSAALEIMRRSAAVSKAALDALQVSISQIDADRLVELCSITDGETRKSLTQFLGRLIVQPLAVIDWSKAASSLGNAASSLVVGDTYGRDVTISVSWQNSLRILQSLAKYRLDELDLPLAQALPKSVEQLRSYLLIRDGGSSHLDLILAAVAQSGAKLCSDELKRCIFEVAVKQRSVTTPEIAEMRQIGVTSLSSFWQAYFTLAPRECLGAALEFYGKEEHFMLLFERPDNLEVMRRRANSERMTEIDSPADLDRRLAIFALDSNAEPMYGQLIGMLRTVFKFKVEANRSLPAVELFLRAATNVSPGVNSEHRGYLAYLGVAREIQDRLIEFNSPSSLLLLTRLTRIEPKLAAIKPSTGSLGALSELLSADGTLRGSVFAPARSANYSNFGDAPWLADLPGLDLSADVKGAWEFLRTIIFSNPPIVPFPTYSIVAGTVDTLRRGDEKLATGSSSTLNEEAKRALITARNQLATELSAMFAAEYQINVNFPKEDLATAPAVRNFVEYRDSLVAAVAAAFPQEKDAKQKGEEALLYTNAELRRVALRLLAVTIALRERGVGASTLSLSDLSSRYFEECKAFESRAVTTQGCVVTKLSKLPFATQRDFNQRPSSNSAIAGAQLLERQIYIDRGSKTAFYRELLQIQTADPKGSISVVSWTGKVPQGFYYLVDSTRDLRIFDLCRTSFALREFNLECYPNYIPAQIDLVLASPEVAIPVLLSSAQLKPALANFIEPTLATRCAADLDVEAKEIYRLAYKGQSVPRDAGAQIDSYLSSVRSLKIATKQQQNAQAQRSVVEREPDYFPGRIVTEQVLCVSYSRMGTHYHYSTRTYQIPPRRNDAKFNALNKLDQLIASARAEQARYAGINLDILEQKTPSLINISDLYYDPATQEFAVRYELLFDGGATVRTTTTRVRMSDLPQPIQDEIKTFPEILLRYKPDFSGAIRGSDKQLVKIMEDRYLLEGGRRAQLLSLRYEALLAREIPVVGHISIEELQKTPGGQKIARGVEVLKEIFENQVKAVPTKGPPRPEFIQELKKQWRAY